MSDRMQQPTFLALVIALSAGLSGAVSGSWGGREAVCLTAILLTGCASVRADAPPESEPAVSIPKLERVSSDVPTAIRARNPVLARDSAERRARLLTARVRNVSCEGVGTGSVFALSIMSCMVGSGRKSTPTVLASSCASFMLGAYSCLIMAWKTW